MPGHKDPEGVIKKNEKGQLYVEMVEKTVPKKVEEKKTSRFDLNKDGKVDIEDVKVALKPLRRGKK